MRRLLLLAVLAACGDGDGNTVDARPLPTTAPGTVPTLFLEYEGGTFHMGEVDDATMNVTKLSIGDITARPHFEGDPDRDAKNAAITARVREVLAPYVVEVVTERPASGAYHMVVITESNGGIMTPPSRFISQSSRGCNEVPNPISFVYERQLPERTEIVTTAVIGLHGIANGITDTSLRGDCMCWQDPCPILATPCVLAGPQTPTPDRPICGEPRTADTARSFLEAFGPRS